MYFSIFSYVIVFLRKEYHFRKEMEKTRLLEWEKSRKTELEQHRQRETEKVITLRAKKETLNTELESLVSLHALRIIEL